MSHANLPIAVHIFLIKGKKILLLHRENTGFNDNKWSVPAGRLEEGESLSLGAIREAKEEVGVEIKVNDFEKKLIMHHHDDRGDRIYCFFLCQKWKNEVKNMEEDKCKEISWFDIEELPKDTLDHIKLALDSILKGETYLEFGF